MLSFTSRFLAALQDPGKAQRARYQVCVLYQYKSTNTDAAAWRARYLPRCALPRKLCVFYQYKSTNTDAAAGTQRKKYKY
jgi:hypothetical protein